VWRVLVSKKGKAGRLQSENGKTLAFLFLFPPPLAGCASQLSCTKPFSFFVMAAFAFLFCSSLAGVSMQPFACQPSPKLV
jgi:hypothetical protein